MNSPLRFAVIGTGFFAQNHLHAWAEIHDVELVAVCDTDPERLAAAARDFGGRPYADARELFANEQLDFVDIATTPPTHPMMVQLAAEFGVPAICQKPLAWDIEDAKAMVAAMAAKGLPFMTHENFRFQYPMRRIKEILDSGAIGRPFFGRFSFRSFHDCYSAQPWLLDSERMIIVDVAVHLFDLARFFLGEPESLYAEALRVNPRIAGEDVATVVMRMPGATAIADASYETFADHSTYPQTFVTLEGTKGVITLGPDYHLTVVTHPVDVGDSAARMTGATVLEEDLLIPEHAWASAPWDGIQDSVVTLQRHWVECLRNGTTPETSGADTLRTMDVTLGAYQSLESGLPYRVGSAL